jgi:hypothetical protein
MKKYHFRQQRIRYIFCITESFKPANLRDTSSGQNRNQRIAAFSFTLRTKYVCKWQSINSWTNHSYKETGSMDSAIESAKRIVPLYTMNKWLIMIGVAPGEENTRSAILTKYKHTHCKDIVLVKRLAGTFARKRKLVTESTKLHWSKI